MAWTTPGTATAGEVLTAAFWNEQVRDNLNVLAPFSAAWTTYTPTLTSTGTNPTLGSGSTATGQYMQVGKLVTVHFAIFFGTSGVNAGTGVYRVGLPVTAAPLTSSIDTVGTCSLFDNSGADFKSGVVVLISGTLAELYYTGTTVYFTQATSPWTWAASDKITGCLTYEAA